jgi:hypothetical protein
VLDLVQFFVAFTEAAAVVADVDMECAVSSAARQVRCRSSALDGYGRLQTGEMGRGFLGEWRSLYARSPGVRVPWPTGWQLVLGGRLSGEAQRFDF